MDPIASDARRTFTNRLTTNVSHAIAIQLVSASEGQEHPHHKMKGERHLHLSPVEEVWVQLTGPVFKCGKC